MFTYLCYISKTEYDVDVSRRVFSKSNGYQYCDPDTKEPDPPAGFLVVHSKYDIPKSEFLHWEANKDCSEMVKCTQLEIDEIDTAKQSHESLVKSRQAKFNEERAKVAAFPEWNLMDKIYKEMASGTKDNWTKLTETDWTNFGGILNPKIALKTTTANLVQNQPPEVKLATVERKGNLWKWLLGAII